MTGITHRVAEERSLALHREVARRILARPELLERARSRVEAWRRSGTVSVHWVDAWAEVLRGTSSEVAAAILDESQRGRDLRQSSPFAGVLDPKTRWEILRRCEKERRARDS